LTLSGGTMAVEGNRVTVGEALARAVALHQAGRLREAEAIYRRVLEVRPDHPDALHLLGIVARQSGRPEAAIDLIGRAIAADGRNPTYHSNLGTAFEAAGRRDAALAAYRRAVELKPDFFEAHQKLGTLLQATGKHEEAVAVLRRAVELRPGAAEVHLTLGTALAKLGRHEEARAAFRRAAELKPELADAHFGLAGALRALGREDEALAALRRTIETKPDHDPALFTLSTFLLERGDARGLLEACDAWLARDAGNRRVLSTKVVALKELGRHEEARALLDFDRFIRPVEIEAPPGFADVAALNAALSHEVRNHPTLVFERAGHATRFGGHTGDILIKPGPAVAALEGVIRRGVSDYLRDLADDPSHPFVAGKPRRWKLQSWSVVMDTQGHQLPHIHTAAWLSGVYYVTIPNSEVPPRDPNAGWIEFGRPQQELHCTAEPEVRLYKPKEGLMLMFPSYFYHMTVPIETKEQRISIAFDVIAEG
jgi:uncharacterized protein (TIGR02466 family)